MNKTARHAPGACAVALLLTPMTVLRTDQQRRFGNGYLELQFQCKDNRF